MKHKKDWTMKTQTLSHTMRFLMISVLALAATASRAQSYSLDWFKVSGGGGASSNSPYTLHGTIGQHDASSVPMTGGNYSLTGGFWALYAVQTPGAPLLSVTLTTTNTVLISWPYPSSGFALQGNSALGTPGWLTVTNVPALVNGRNQVIVAPPVGNQFYRLRNP
jgi:hypothetical protein